MNKTLLFILLVILIASMSCTRYYTPFQAAQGGGKCSPRKVIR